MSEREQGGNNRTEQGGSKEGARREQGGSKEGARREQGGSKEEEGRGIHSRAKLSQQSVEQRDR
jgi:hypothetical protein